MVRMPVEVQKVDNAPEKHPVHEIPRDSGIEKSLRTERKPPLAENLLPLPHEERKRRTANTARGTALPWKRPHAQPRLRTRHRSKNPGTTETPGVPSRNLAARNLESWSTASRHSDAPTTRTAALREPASLENTAIYLAPNGFSTSDWHSMQVRANGRFSRRCLRMSWPHISHTP